MAKDEHFNLFILITLLLDIASSSYISQETGQERPKEELTLTKETATKHVDDTFIVVCKDQRGLPVAWKGPKGRLGARTHPKVQQGSYGTSIVFDKIRIGDTGNYTCTAGGSKKSRIFRLTVEEDFNFTKTPDIQESIEGQTAKIVCRTNLDNVDTSWSLANGEVLTNELNHLNGGAAFIIKNVSRKDANVYTCQALHKITGRLIYKNITFVVQHKPYPVYAQENVVYGFVDEALNLTCEVEANPPPKIRWVHRNMGNIIDESSHKSVLQLNVTEDAPGDYKCISSNRVGTFEKIFTVEIGVRPNPPQNVSLVEATSTSLEISIQLGNISIEGLPSNMEPTTLLIEYRPVSEGDNEWLGDKLNITVERASITELDKNTKYEIRVATINEAGIVSEYYDAIFTTTSLAISIHTKSTNFNILVYLIMLLIPTFWLA